MARSLYRARTRGLDRLLKDATETERSLQPAVRGAMEELEGKMLATYRRFVPVESGRMRDAIYTRLHTFPGGAVQARVGIGATVDPITGYDYFEQTREGRGPVEVVRATQLVLSLGRDQSGRPSARRPVGPVVAGWAPEIDWAEVAERNSRRHTTATQRRIGQGISRRGLLRTYGT